jgi:hypothetical protein
MTISNLTGMTIQYNVQDQTGNYNDGGTLNANSYVEFQPRGVAPFAVTWMSPSITLVNVPSPAIVTYWRCGTQNNGGFSQ